VDHRRGGNFMDRRGGRVVTRPLVIAGVALSLVFALLVSSLRLQAQNESVGDYFGDCTLPCWQQVQPGVTARAEALASLKPRGWMFDTECNAAVYDTCYTFAEAGPSGVAYLYIDADQVVQIALLDSGMTLGEILLTFGAPDYATIPPNRGRAITFFTSLWFGRAGISARMSVPCPAGYPDVLRTRVSTILVWAPGTRMRGDVLGTLTDLRQTLRQICDG